MEQIKKVTYKEQPQLFEDLLEMSVDSEMDHRRGSNFFRYDIVEFRPEHKEYYPDVENYEDYLGFWKTDTWIFDSEYGSDKSPSELTRVEKRVKVVGTVEWGEV